MIATNHAVVGALIATVIPQPLIAIPVAFLSHFVLDLMPHYHGKDLNAFLKVLGPDTFLAATFIGLLFLLQPDHWPLLIVCAITAMSPDLMWLPNFVRTLKKKKLKEFNFIMRFHKNLQWGERTWGLLIEVPWLVTMSYALIVLSR